MEFSYQAQQNIMTDDLTKFYYNPLRTVQEIAIFQFCPIVPPKPGQKDGRTDGRTDRRDKVIPV